MSGNTAPVNARVRVLVVDDHALFRRGLIALLAREPSLQVVGDAADAGQAQRRAKELQPDLILLDVDMPGVRGVDALPALREAAPKAHVLMLTVSEDEQDLSIAVRSGAAGYLLKSIEGDELGRAIARVMRGESVLAPEMTGKLMNAIRGASAGAAPADGSVGAQSTSPEHAGALQSLSPREREVLRGIARGASNKDIGAELGIAETTVKIHVQHVLRKLGVSSRVQVAVLAANAGVS